MLCAIAAIRHAWKEGRLLQGALRAVRTQRITGHIRPI